jgi:hypothetical protein
MAVITYSTAHPDEGEDRWSLTGGCCEYVFLDGLGHPTEIPDIADHEFKDAGHSAVPLLKLRAKPVLPP